jgi:hypothetical protein
MKRATVVLAAFLASLGYVEACGAQATPVAQVGGNSIATVRERAQAGDLNAMRQLGTTLLNDANSADDEEGLDWLR